MLDFSIKQMYESFCNRMQPNPKEFEINYFYCESFILNFKTNDIIKELSKKLF